MSPPSSSSCAAEAGLVAMDCVVVCCCCPCLVLQITVFLFVRLPRKVVVKSKSIILRRWHRRRSSSAKRRNVSRSGSAASSSSGAMRRLEELLDADFGATFRDINGGWECSDGDDSWKERCFTAMEDDGGWKQRCFAVDDDDGVWEALVEQEGLFWLGSFWGRTEQGGSGVRGGPDVRGLELAGSPGEGVRRLAWQHGRVNPSGSC